MNDKKRTKLSFVLFYFVKKLFFTLKCSAAVVAVLGIVFLWFFEWSIPRRWYRDSDILAIRSVPLSLILNIHVGEKDWLFIDGKRVREPRSGFPFFQEIKDKGLVVYGVSYVLFKGLHNDT